MTIKLTKTELRIQQTRLGQFQRYLPTLQLKKAMLQFEVNSCADGDLPVCKTNLHAVRGTGRGFFSLSP